MENSFEKRDVAGKEGIMKMYSSEKTLFFHVSFFIIRAFFVFLEALLIHHLPHRECRALNYNLNEISDDISSFCYMRARLKGREKIMRWRN